MRERERERERALGEGDWMKIVGIGSVDNGQKGLSVKQKIL